MRVDTQHKLGQKVKEMEKENKTEWEQNEIDKKRTRSTGVERRIDRNRGGKRENLKQRADMYKTVMRKEIRREKYKYTAKKNGNLSKEQPEAKKTGKEEKKIDGIYHSKTNMKF